ncbi:Centromere protein N [Merluccius polli]|uniref:Centromere protein N n=1 Tax=Merluccius polli TaxID=89951 RepID=A0AA47MSF9_MERPO|nr:Centromere protein N [Merluccius polli]
MEDRTRRMLQQLIRRIPTQMLKTSLSRWGRLDAEQWRSLDFTQRKVVWTESLLALCEESGLGVKHITELEMIYDARSVELTHFKEQFKAHLAELNRHVSVKIKKHTDEEVWIRIAWGDSFSRPNHLKPTYVVCYLQTPYVFVNNLTSVQKPLLSQALILATRYSSIKDANLSGRKLTGIRDLLMKQFRQLETKLKDNTNKIMTEREQPFRCVVTFASTNILESLRDSAMTGIASTPVTPLLSSITQKGRNHFVISDKGPGRLPQTPHPTK